MASLKIQTATGIKKIELTKDSPVTIGSHTTNDIVITDSGVSTMHCRISWNGKAYEIVSANPEGIDIDGELVRFKVLEPRTQIKVGQAVVTYEDLEREDELAREQLERIDDGGGFLKPISEEYPSYRKKEKLLPLREDFKDDNDEGGSLLPEIEKSEDIESEIDPGTLKRRQERAERKAKRKAEREAKNKADAEADAEGEPSDDPFAKLADEKGNQVGLDSQSPSREKSSTREKDRRSSPVSRHRTRRPGQEDILSSPIVLGLGGLVVVLLIVAGTYGFLILRNLADQQLQAADAQRDEGKHQQAIKLYSDFLVAYPRHRLTPKAKVSLAETQIEAQIGGSSGKWPAGLEKLKGFIDNSKTFDTDEDLTPRFEAISYRIAEGAATDAGKSFQRDLLLVSDDAKAVWQRFAPEGEDTRQRLRHIDDVRKQSVASIIRQEKLVAAMAGLDASIAAKNTMDGFRIRRELLNQYPELKDQKEVSSRLTKLLDLEQTATTKDDDTVSALNYDVKVANAVISTLVNQSRSRSDRRSTGKIVISHHKDTLLGIDALTGEPLWRRPVGLDLPFFPIPISGAKAGYLLVNTRNRDLELIEQSTGQLIWRQPLEDEIDDAPLVLEGQIYLSSRSARLYQIDAETGRILGCLQFSQPVHGPICLLADKEHFAVAGQAEVIYILKRRPLEAIKAIYYGHGPESIAGSFLAAGANLLLFENLSLGRSRVTALDGRQWEKGLPVAGQLDLEGEIHDPSLLRGNILFVPTRPEQLYAVAVSDVVGQTALSRLAGYQLQTGQESELYLSAGPNNHVWVSGSQLRKYQLTADSITVDEKTVPLGRTIQPIQSSSNDLYSSFLPPDQNGATTSQFDRDSLLSEWKLDHAGRILAWTRDPRDDKSLIAVTEDGNIHRSSVDRVVGSRFQKSPASTIKRPQGNTGSLNACELANGELAVWSMGEKPQMWLINAAGQTQKSFVSPGILEASPVKMGGLILLPVSGKIVVANLSGTVQEEIVTGKPNDVKWSSIYVVDESHLLVVDDAGTMTAFEMRTEPRIGFVKRSSVELDGFLFDTYLAETAMIAVASDDRAVRLFDARNLELVDELRPEGGTARSVVPTGEGFLLCSGENTVEFFETTSPKPERKWSGHSNWKSFPLACVSLGSELICVFPQGLITKHDRGSGKVNGHAFLAQLLEGDPMWLGSMLVIPTLDGSLCLLNLQPSGSSASTVNQSSESAVGMNQ